MKDNLDKLLEQLFGTDYMDIKGIGDIEIPDMEETMRRAQNSMKTESFIRLLPVKNKKGRLLVRAACILGIVVLSVILSAVYDNQSVKAFRLNVIRTYIYTRDGITAIINTDKAADPLSEEKKNKDAIIKKVELGHTNRLPFNLLVPSYLPPGYVFDNAVWTEYLDGTHNVEQHYKDGEGRVLSIIQEYRFTDVNEKMNINPGNSVARIIDLNGQQVSLVTINGTTSFAVWYANGCKYKAVGDISGKELVHVIKKLH